MEVSAGRARYRAQLAASGGVVAWGLAWAASLALARFGPALWGESVHAITWVAVGVNLVLGAAWLVAFARFLRVVDELDRRILQNALSTAVGTGLVLGAAAVAAESGGLIPVGIDIAALLVTMAVVFLVAFVVGRIQHR